MGDLPIKKNVARTIYIPGLISQANTKTFQTNPTIAAGDFKYSLDGGAWTNLATLPDVYPASGTQVRLQLAQAELNCDQLNIRWQDASGAEWCDGSLMILTATLQTGDTATATVSDKTGFALTSAYDAAKTAAPTGAAMTLTSAYDAAKTAAPTVGQIDTQLSNTHGSGIWGPSGTGGSKTLNYTVTDTATSLPVQGATVELYPTSAYSGIIDSQVTDILGQVTFSNLVAGTYYLKIIKTGYETGLDSEVVS